MAVELVLLSEVPLTEEVHHRAYKRLGMTGEMLEWLDGQVSTLHDETGRHVLRPGRLGCGVTSWCLLTTRKKAVQWLKRSPPRSVA